MASIEEERRGGEAKLCVLPDAPQHLLGMLEIETLAFVQVLKDNEFVNHIEIEEKYPQAYKSLGKLPQALLSNYETMQCRLLFRYLGNFRLVFDKLRKKSWKEWNRWE